MLSRLERIGDLAAKRGEFSLTARFAECHERPNPEVQFRDLRCGFTVADIEITSVSARIATLSPESPQIV